MNQWMNTNRAAVFTVALLVLIAVYLAYTLWQQATDPDLIVLHHFQQGL